MASIVCSGDILNSVFWSARFAQYNCFLARALMPVDDREETARPQYSAHCKRQSLSIGNAVKSIRHGYKVSEPRDQFGKLIGIACHIGAIRRAVFGQTVTRHFQKIGVYVDCNDAKCDLGNLQREPPVAGTRQLPPYPL
jgi:hypothetical protein